MHKHPQPLNNNNIIFFTSAAKQRTKLHKSSNVNLTGD